MVNAFKQTVIVQQGGRIEIFAPELVEGSEAEVIVLLENGVRDTSGEEEIEDIRAYLDAKAEMVETGEQPKPLSQVIDEIAAERARAA